MTQSSKPPDIVARMADVERQVKDLQRSQNPVAPNITALNDVSGQPSSNGLLLEYDRTSGTWQAAEVFAPGDVKWSANNATPIGRWIDADGSAVSRSTYADLFAAIGTSYGAGNGSTTFNVPNLAGRLVLGVGTDALGATGGSRNAVVGSHTHTTGHAATSAEVSGYGLPPNDQDVAFENRVRVNRATGVGTGDVTDSTGSSVTDANMQPWIALWAYVRY